MYTRTYAKASTNSKPSSFPLGRSLAPESSLLMPKKETQPLPERDRSPSLDPNSTISLNQPGRGYSFGNLAIEPKERLGVQTKLTIGQPHDRYEQEADRVADQVMRMPEPVSNFRQPSIQRLCPQCEEELQRQPTSVEEEEEEKEPLQMKSLQRQVEPTSEEEEEDEEKETLQMKPLQRQVEPTSEEEEEDEKEPLQMKSISGKNAEASPDLQKRISGLQSRGQPLAESERAFLEPRFGYDFSRVRVHADDQAAEMAHSINARAFTVGQNVVFGAGQYQPRSSQGQRLLAHELTHVVQQNSVPHTHRQPLDRLHIQQSQENDHSEIRINRKEDVNETVNKLTEDKKKPQDLESETAESIGREALQVFGYERIMKIAVEAGFIEEKAGNKRDNVQKQSQNSETRIFRQAELAPTFWGVFAPYAATAGVTSQVDTPAPGPADVVAIGILVVGLAIAGYTVLMASSGNQADTGIMDEVQALIRAGQAATVCAALELLMQLAKQAGDRAKIQRIKKTQKAKGCRHSRHS